MQTINQSQQQQQQQQQHQPSYLSTTSSNATKKTFFGQFSSSNSINKAGQSSSQQLPDDIRIQIYYSGIITVIYLKINAENAESSSSKFDLSKFREEVRVVCKFDQSQPYTLKWVDEEGDPCTISSQEEFDEAVRLYYVNKESELVVHVFANLPARPGASCVGEDRSIYRRGARRWRKIYLVVYLFIFCI